MLNNRIDSNDRSSAGFINREVRQGMDETIPNSRADSKDDKPETLGRMRTIAATLCILEPQTAAHAREMFFVLRDPAIYEFENEPPPSEEWLRRRYERLEAGRSADGRERWFNWVLRLPSGELAGYVQATVLQDGTSYIAYELNSRFWRQGIGSSAVLAMAEELRVREGVHTLLAVLKARNHRSLAFLKSLGFVRATADLEERIRGGEDEIVHVKRLAPESHKA